MMEFPAFEVFSIQHFIPLIIGLFFGIAVILYARNKSEYQQKRIGLLLCLIPFASVLIRMIYIATNGEFTLQTELPFHLCRFIAIVFPFIMYFKWRRALGIFYFWTIIGTLNANLTPDLKFAFPHFDFINYFVTHVSLVICGLYPVLVYRFKMTWRDVFHTILATNAFALFTFILNCILGSNYFYTMEKPPVESLIDLLGPWPWYIFTIQPLIFVFCVIVLLPFLFKRSKEATPSES